MIEGSDAIYSILGNQKLVIEGRKYPLVSSDAVLLGLLLMEQVHIQFLWEIKKVFLPTDKISI
jgi:hypothetical protein